MLRPRLGALWLAYALGVYGALGGLPKQSAHELHLMLAQHARDAFFSVVSHRWDLGVSVAGHPPLFHQLVSLVSRVPLLNVERAYALLLALLPALLVWTVGQWVERLSTPRGGDIAAWLVAAGPLVALFVFPFAQGPFVLGIILALWASLFWLNAGLRGHHAGVALLGSAALLSASVACHPFAGLFGLLFWGAVMLYNPRCALGMVASIALAAGVAVVSLGPFWAQASKGSVSLPSAVLAKSWVGAVFSGLMLLGGVVGAGLARGPIRAAGAVTILLWAAAFLMPSDGAGPDFWLWMGCLLSVVCWALAFSHGSRNAALVSAVVVLTLASAWAMGRQWTEGYGRRTPALAEARQLLDGPGAGGFRYITLGLGAERFQLARMVAASSLDSAFPWVPASTTHSIIDELALGDDTARAQFDALLAQRDGLHLRWVVTKEQQATPVLEAQGFELRGAWADGLSVWENAAVPALSSLGAGADDTSLPWALMPMGMLALGVVLGSATGLFRRELQSA